MVSLTEIERSKVFADTRPGVSGASPTLLASAIMLADFLRKVNPEDGWFFKYIPVCKMGLLREECIYMPCFSCTCFCEGRGRNGEVLFGGRGYCKLKDQEYYRGHECRSYSPTWYAPKNTGDPMKEPSGCFLTSACVEYLGLPDDCKELTTLRTIRDKVLKATGEGRGLVDEYYRIAPALVEKINA